MTAISNRKTPRQPLIGVALLAVPCAVLAACGSSGSTRSASPPPASSAPANGNANTPTPNGSALEGTWRTGNVTVADMTAVLSRAGLQKWIQPFRAGAAALRSATVAVLGYRAWAARREPVTAAV